MSRLTKKHLFELSWWRVKQKVGCYSDLKIEMVGHSGHSDAWLAAVCAYLVLLADGILLAHFEAGL